MSSDALASWNDTATRRAIVEFVGRATTEDSPDYLAPAERVAVFDNDGTLWCEKPMPIELGFILERLAEMAETDTSLRDRQPWKAAYERDFAWLSAVITKHYHGDDGDVKVLMGGIVGAFAGMTVEDYAAAAAAFLRDGRHPTNGRSFRDCGYMPMIELLRYLEQNGFTTYIASGGDRDFMRPITEEMYGIPSERVIGSSTALRYQEDEFGGSLVYLAELDVFDDGPAKPVKIWNRVGRRPVVAGGNSNGDIAMLHHAGGPSRARAAALRLLVLHDDAEREFDYTAGAEQSLERADAEGWTVVSIKDDWASVFADPVDATDGTTDTAADDAPPLTRSMR
jgi:phosphoserine phosphatase